MDGNVPVRARNVSLLAAFAASALTAVPGHAAGRIDSAYTRLNFAECEVIVPASDEGTAGDTLRCAGYRGIPVYVAEGDLRMLVSFGPNAAGETAASQTLPAFNTINETIEWRLVDEGGWTPFATIQRWYPQIDDGDTSRTGQVLVVTRLGTGETCHVAYIDAARTPDANVVARRIADEEARSFRCDADEIIRVNMDP